ncbi:hemolysin [Chryseobacterium indologenes]|uniref:thiol-activated cytolysin family protein n=1 Tax=Chryseobacterium TaxID=59732 RepID=UPI00068ED62C|nr:MULTISPECIES: thiol-activated cytolysin family protein [Chryseobacterium]ASE62364.1 hemolysin [Chryseobacterium indologenes]ATN06197.1 hemolysin [Chryseobacterium indologenes]AYY85043.1 hemolysin [Chryseobacterium indologenes]AYZ34714.1 hemolysin [Chryseobacterium indologenes]MBF6643297.1 thiol-activated cytolysin family protein [Chryseobacterium indologenes]
MKKLMYMMAAISMVALSSCANELDKQGNEKPLNRTPEQVINITSFGTYPSVLQSGKNRSMLGKGDPETFTETREFESSESIVLPHLQMYIFPGSLLKGNSIQDMNFKPITASVKPITVSMSIPALNKKTAFTIDKPSLSNTRQVVQDYIQSADFTQNGTLSYSVEQFTSYDELKVAFGSNVNTRSLFGKNSSSTNIEEGMITKRTGFYVKFYQTSFTLDMDIPSGSLVNDTNLDTGGVEPVYVSSISYGRMGVLAIETNELAETARTTINETFSKLFVKGESYLTQEEKNFLNGADFNLYMIGGSGVTAAQSFKGYEAFVNHVSKGTFSKSQPGVPIFCTYSYLNDNSPVKTSFKFDIKNPPVYVKLVKENIVTSGRIKNADIKLYFYSSKSQTNTIAHPSIRFVINKTTTNGVSGNGDHFTYTTTTEPIVLQNAGLNTNMTIPNQRLSSQQGVCKPRGQHPCEFIITKTEDVAYTIAPSDKYNYIVIN